MLKEAPAPSHLRRGLPMCPGRQTDPARQNRNGQLVSERLREMVSERLRSPRTKLALGKRPDSLSIADEMREEHRRRVLGG